MTPHRNLSLCWGISLPFDMLSNEDVHLVRFLIHCRLRFVTPRNTLYRIHVFYEVVQLMVRKQLSECADACTGLPLPV
jgi:hypothetical protein